MSLTQSLAKHSVPPSGEWHSVFTEKLPFFSQVNKLLKCSEKDLSNKTYIVYLTNIVSRFGNILLTTIINECKLYTV